MEDPDWEEQKEVTLTFADADLIVLALETLERKQAELIDDLMYERGLPDASFACVDAKGRTSALLERFLNEWGYDEYEDGPLDDGLP